MVIAVRLAVAVVKEVAEAVVACIFLFSLLMLDNNNEVNVSS